MVKRLLVRPHKGLSCLLPAPLWQSGTLSRVASCPVWCHMPSRRIFIYFRTISSYFTLTEVCAGRKKLQVPGKPH